MQRTAVDEHVFVYPSFEAYAAGQQPYGFNSPCTIGQVLGCFDRTGRFGNYLTVVGESTQWSSQGCDQNSVLPTGHHYAL